MKAYALASHSRTKSNRKTSDEGLCTAWFSSPVTAQRALERCRNIQDAILTSPMGWGLTCCSTSWNGNIRHSTSVLRSHTPHGQSHMSATHRVSTLVHQLAQIVYLVGENTKAILISNHTKSPENYPISG